jgi:hypothetical protein
MAGTHLPWLEFFKWGPPTVGQVSSESAGKDCTTEDRPECPRRRHGDKHILTLSLSLSLSLTHIHTHTHRLMSVYTQSQENVHVPQDTAPVLGSREQAWEPPDCRQGGSS